MSKMIVYRIYNIANNKSYIGVTNNMDRRWEEHKKKTKFILKEGAENFVMEELFKCKERFSALYIWEPYYIGKYDSLETGYNRKGGMRPYQYCEMLRHFKKIYKPR